jgi:hypothetical protein
MDDGSTALCDEDLEMLVVLRINRKFMEFVRTSHAGALHETFKLGSVVRDEDNETDSEDDDDAG